MKLLFGYFGQRGCQLLEVEREIFFPGRDSRRRRGRLWTFRGGGLFSAEEEGAFQKGAEVNREKVRENRGRREVFPRRFIIYLY